MKRGFCCWTFRASLLDPHHRATVAVLSRIRHQKIATRQLVYRAPPRQRSLAAVIEKCILDVTGRSTESFASLLPILGQEKDSESHVRPRSSCSSYLLFYRNNIPTFIYKRNCFVDLSIMLSQKCLSLSARSCFIWPCWCKHETWSVKCFGLYLRSSSNCRRTRFVCIETQNIVHLYYFLLKRKKLLGQSNRLTFPTFSLTETRKHS